MNKVNTWICTVLIMTTVACSERSSMTNLYDISVQPIQGESISLNEYRGKTLSLLTPPVDAGLPVNTKDYKHFMKHIKTKAWLYSLFHQITLWGKSRAATNPLPLFVKRAFKSPSHSLLKLM